MTITGRYILQPEIFDLLGKQAAGAGGEIQLTDAMVALSRTQPFYGLKFEGRSFDCGSKTGFLAANVAYGLARPDIEPEFRAEFETASGKYVSRGRSRFRLAAPPEMNSGGAADDAELWLVRRHRNLSARRPKWRLCRRPRRRVNC